MKTSRIKLKSSLALILSLSATVVWSRPVAQVIELKGQVFRVSPDGKTSSLRVNDHLDEKTEVMVEEGASITLNDYYDATYHLAGGTHLKFFNKSVQLKRGKSWIKSKSNKNSLALTTANGQVDFMRSEYIMTFDQATSRSQVLVVNGDVEFSNVLDREMKYSVPAGSFSLIDPEVESGLPRSPTKVGLNSLNTALAEFKGLPTEKTGVPARGIASVVEETPKGEIIFMSSNRLPASVSGQAHKYFKQTAKAAAVAPTQLISAPIYFYGVNQSAKVEAVDTAQPRQPASLLPSKISKLAQDTAKELRVDEEFSQSLKTHHAKQPKHTKELEVLIEELKSY